MTVWTHVIGWAIVHFVWQGATIGVLGAVALRWLRFTSPQARYVVACVALVTMVACPVITSVSVARARRPAALARVEPVTFDAAPMVASSPEREVQTGSASRLLRGKLERLLPLVVWLWLIGVGVFVVRLVTGWRHMRRLHRSALAAPTSRLQQVGDVIAARLHLRRVVHIVDSDLVDTPTAVGWRRPVVLVPIAALAQLSPTQVDAILTHELCHIRRHDFVVNVLQSLAEVFLFYHPAVWWLSGQIRVEREHCCDDAAVTSCGDPLVYVEALKQVEADRHGSATPMQQAPLALAAASGSLVRRVRRLLRVDGETQRASSSAVITIAAVVAVIVLVAGRDRVKALGAPAAIDSRDAPAFASASITSMPPLTPQSPGFLCGFGKGGAFKAFGPVDWIITCAYGIPAARTDQQLIGGPSWLKVDLFQIEAQAPPDHIPTSASEGLPMLRTLLADRFKLAVHRETKELETFDLSVASADGALGPRMRPTPPECASWIRSKRKGPQPSRPGYRECGFARVTRSLITNTAITMPQLANLLTPRMGQVVRDMTGLRGYFDVDLSYTPVPADIGTTVERGDALLGALRIELGLRLDPSTSSIDRLVVDHVEHPNPE